MSHIPKFHVPRKTPTPFDGAGAKVYPHDNASYTGSRHARLESVAPSIVGGAP
jgi:hypothetical protein